MSNIMTAIFFTRFFALFITTSNINCEITAKVDWAAATGKKQRMMMLRIARSGALLKAKFTPSRQQVIFGGISRKQVTTCTVQVVTRKILPLFVLFPLTRFLIDGIGALTLDFVPCQC